MFLKEKYLVRVSKSAIKPWHMHKEETQEGGDCSVLTSIGHGQGQRILTRSQLKLSCVTPWAVSVLSHEWCRSLSQNILEDHLKVVNFKWFI